jgi:hypothetical protein
MEVHVQILIRNLSSSIDGTVVDVPSGQIFSDLWASLQSKDPNKFVTKGSKVDFLTNLEDDDGNDVEGADISLSDTTGAWSVDISKSISDLGFVDGGSLHVTPLAAHS